MGSSFNINFQNTDSNASAQTNSNSIISPQIYNQKTNDIFENAMTAEIKNELRNKIKEELIEDFELKLKQKDIENSLKLNKQTEQLEAEKKDLIEKYEQLVAKYRSDLEVTPENQATLLSRHTNKLTDVSSSSSSTSGNIFEDEKQEIEFIPIGDTKQRQSVEIQFECDENTIQKLKSAVRKRQIGYKITESTLFWCYALIK
eukprot:119768_1